MPARPRRQRKGDRLLSPGSSKTEIECDYAVAPMDRLAVQMDAKWGVDRLPELVSPELAQRYGAAIAHLNECINANDPAQTKAAAENCMRGLKAMDAAAEAAGAETPDTIAEYDLEGFRFAIIQDAGDWVKIKNERPDLFIFSMREVAVALRDKRAGHWIDIVKQQFPDAVVKSVKTKKDDLNDPIPNF